jgi:hypothetical protein
VTIVCAVDPGPQVLGYVCWDTAEQKLLVKENISSEEFIQKISDPTLVPGEMLLVEQAVIYQKSAASIHDTIFYYGRLCRDWQIRRGDNILLVPRLTIIGHILGPELRKACFGKKNMSRDSAVIAELTSRYGGKGTKAEPGFFFGVSSHMWNAIALAVYYQDCVEKKEVAA